MARSHKPHAAITAIEIKVTLAALEEVIADFDVVAAVFVNDDQGVPVSGLAGKALHFAADAECFGVYYPKEDRFVLGAVL